MSGIAGLTWPDQGSVERLLTTMSHRGVPQIIPAPAPWSIGVNGEAQLTAEGNRYAAVVGEIYQKGWSCCGQQASPVLHTVLIEDPHGIDGQFAAVFQGEDGAFHLTRDYPGIMPLFYTRTPKGLAFATEHDALVAAGFVAVEPVIPGTTVCYRAGRVTVSPWQPMTINQTPNHQDLDATLNLAVRRAVTHQVSDKHLGILLSGGVDSSLLALYAQRHAPGLTCFTLDGPDVSMARMTCAHLGIDRHVVVPADDLEECATLYRSRPYNRQFDMLNRSLFAPCYLLARAAKHLGIRVLLTADGVDEAFGGYEFNCAQNALRKVSRMMVDSMTLYSLDRLDEACMVHGIQPRLPFLSRDVLSAAFNQECFQMRDKIGIRVVAERYLPDDIAWRPKCPMQVSTGSYRRITGRDWVSSYMSQ